MRRVFVGECCSSWEGEGWWCGGILEPVGVVQVETKDALLHAINEEYVEAVEVLLEHEESIHKEGELWVGQSHATC
jgi:hypothetical protein